MENAFAIVDEYVISSTMPLEIDDPEQKVAASVVAETSPSSSNASSKNYLRWAKRQIPRILTGIGDLYVSVEKYPYGVDAYTRAIPFREAQLEECKSNANEKEKLRQHRLLCEANVLVSETLLRCDPEEDVVVKYNQKKNEDETLLVSAAERVDFARGYYEKARSDLQDAGT